ncbi:hypothetical protein AAF712_006622 [Marasmius tenuissimus]|uniref:Uncharacterized protein n=1 Tax=Marasmius tenuissimus TaxID=585030 RepID=A0ABR3A020_9AGAR
MSSVATDRSDNLYHVGVQVACLRATRTLVESFRNVVNKGDQLEETYAIYANLIESSLLQNCPLGPELFTLCGEIASLSRAAKWPLLGSVDHGHLLPLRNKLVKWLKTFPAEYAEEARRLKADMLAGFPI